MRSGKDRAGSTDSLFFVHRPFLRTFGRSAALLLGACATLGLGSGARAQTPAESHAKVELISDGNPGATTKVIWVGLLFHLDQGWHIYWQNAGDSGEPPKVSWNLPPGFRAGAIRWPQPMRLGSGSVVDYGYEDEVLLMARIEQPLGSRAGAAIPIAADVEYVVCREVCIPGKAHLTLPDPATSEASEWRGLFERARAHLPKAAPASWKLSATSDMDHFVLSAETGSQVESATFFPLGPNQIENSARQEFASTGNGFRLTLQKSDQLMKPISTLKGLVVLGPGQAFEVAVPVAAR
jgi:DsbC/DsbD-like thiol-disulfide interchange protein